MEVNLIGMDLWALVRWYFHSYNKQLRFALIQNLFEFVIVSTLQIKAGMIAIDKWAGLLKYKEYAGIDNFKYVMANYW